MRLGSIAMATTTTFVTCHSYQVDVPPDCGFDYAEPIYDKWHVKSAYIRTRLGKIFLYNLLPADEVLQVDRDSSKEYFKEIATTLVQEEAAEKQRQSGNNVRVDEVLLEALSTKKRRKSGHSSLPAVVG